jgi:hypothetical protein
VVSATGGFAVLVLAQPTKAKLETNNKEIERTLKLGAFGGRLWEGVIIGS